MENTGISDLIRDEGEHDAARVPEGQIKPLALAYLGDTLFDLYVRTHLVMTTHLSPGEMHIRASSLVNAASQARIMKHLLPDLTEEEALVFKHARNQKSLTVPKNMSVIDYKWATGLEALLGYLYVCGKDNRLCDLMDQGVSWFLEEQKHDDHPEAAP